MSSYRRKSGQAPPKGTLNMIEDEETQMHDKNKAYAKLINFVLSKSLPPGTIKMDETLGKRPDNTKLIEIDGVFCYNGRYPVVNYCQFPEDNPLELICSLKKPTLEANDLIFVESTVSCGLRKIQGDVNKYDHIMKNNYFAFGALRTDKTHLILVHSKGRENDQQMYEYLQAKRSLFKSVSLFYCTLDDLLNYTYPLRKIQMPITPNDIYDHYHEHGKWLSDQVLAFKLAMMDKEGSVIFILIAYVPI